MLLHLGLYNIQGPVVQRLISPNPGLNFNSGFLYFFVQKSFRENFYYSF